jgi:DNA modification methylase
VALKAKRKYVGCELKESYYNLAAKNLYQAQSESLQPNLLDMMGYAG